ncbi:hypothetical protein PV646_28820 [Streptomyces sp. ID05-26A]|nr:hypothetical protein [Streptomyces sp. ID05-26A]
MSEYDLDALVAQHRDATGGDDLVFTFGGEKFTMPNPVLADDEWKDELAEITSDVVMAEYVLGEQYDKFRELGGRASYIALLMRSAQADFVDTDPRTGRPTRRSTSSPAPRKRPKRR